MKFPDLGTCWAIMMVPWEKIQGQLHQAEEGSMSVSGKVRQTMVCMTSVSNETGEDEGAGGHEDIIESLVFSFKDMEI